MRLQCEQTPDHPDLWSRLGELYLLRGDPAAARTSFQEMARLRPDALAFYSLGNTWLAEEKFHEAAEAFRRARTLDPDSAEVAGGLGYAYFRLGDLEKAKPLLRKATDEDPEDEESHLAMAKISAAEGDLRQAIDRCMQILQHNPLDPVSPLLLMGDCCLALGALPQAEQAYAQAIQTDPENVAVFAGLAQIQMLLGHHADAEETLKLAAAMDPDSSDVQLAWGNFSLHRNDVQRARRHYERALNSDPHQIKAYGALAATFLQQDEPTKAARIAEQGLQVAPADVECLLILAQVAELDGRFEDAVRFAEKAIFTTPENFHAHFLLGRAEAARRGDMAKARRHLALAEQQAPTDDAKQRVQKLLRAIDLRYGQ